MHSRPSAGQSGGKVADQSAQVVVRQRVGGVDQRRLRGHPSPEAAAAFDVVNARDRLDADLSMSRDPGADASASDRHGTVQIRRIQTEPVDNVSSQSGLLETGATL